jgi:hypothetical protein
MPPKKKPTSSGNYFGEKEELAVIKLLSSTEINERSKIYSEELVLPINKMIESIIRKYKLYSKFDSFEDVHADTVSFLITKAHMFDHNKGHKAYSYLGTICKNHLLGMVDSENKKIKRNISYEDISESIEDDEKFSYTIDSNGKTISETINNLIKQIEIEIDKDSGKKKLSENEIKVGFALIDILKNWDNIFSTPKPDHKYNRLSALETMRDYTNLSTKDIRVAMKRFKNIYQLLKFS